MIEKPNITLAIESAINGGSLSLLRGNSEITGWVGSASLSRAEDLLPNIDRLLRENEIATRDIDLIAVSAGPGSFTGIRIGIATAMGLKAGLGIRMASVSALDAVATQFGHKHDHAMVAVPVGRDAVCVQRYEKNPEPDASTEPANIRQSELSTIARHERELIVLAHSSIVEILADAGNFVDVGANIARYVGLACIANAENTTPPMFIGKSF